MPGASSSQPTQATAGPPARLLVVSVLALYVVAYAVTHFTAQHYRELNEDEPQLLDIPWYAMERDALAFWPMALGLAACLGGGVLLWRGGLRRSGGITAATGMTLFGWELWRSAVVRVLVGNCAEKSLRTESPWGSLALYMADPLVLGGQLVVLILSLLALARATRLPEPPPPTP